MVRCDLEGGVVKIAIVFLKARCYCYVPYQYNNILALHWIILGCGTGNLVICHIAYLSSALNMT